MTKITKEHREKTGGLDWEILSRILSMTKPYRTLFISTLVLAVILAPVSVIRPYLIKVMVDDHILVGDIGGLKFLAAIYIGFVFLAVILRYIFIYSTALVGNSVVKDFRTRAFNHLSKLNLSFFDSTPIGKVTTRTINDIEAVNTVFSQGIITIVADIISVFAVLGIMLYTSWKLTLICLMTLPLLIVATYIFKVKVKAAYQKVRNQLSDMNSFLQERITGMRIIQIFNAEEQELEKFKAINRKYTQANLDSILYYAVFFPVVELVSAISLALLVWWGAGSYLEDSVSFGALVAFPIFLSMLFRPVRMLADKFNTLQMGLVAAERVFRVLDNNQQIKDYGTHTTEHINGRVEFKNVTFAYDDENNVLKNINFTIEPGETLAILGSTGSGKTTIINLLNRFYQLKEGKILIDDVEIEKYDLTKLRSQFAMVLQDVFLFNGSVAENITLKDDSYVIEDVIRAAKLIGAHRFFVDLPEGYEFMVMERGANLSMGQRQLISFVRSIITDPGILILDEATSSIDTETEETIQFAIERLISKRTSIIIAHRLSTIKHADKIIVMDKGRIVEMGSHSELVGVEEGHYRKLYEMQFAEA